MFTSSPCKSSTQRVISFCMGSSCGWLGAPSRYPNWQMSALEYCRRLTQAQLGRISIPKSRKSMRLPCSGPTWKQALSLCWLPYKNHRSYWTKMTPPNLLRSACFFCNFRKSRLQHQDLSTSGPQYLMTLVPQNLIPVDLVASRP